MNIHELIAEICDSNDKLHATIRHWRENCGKLEAQLKIAEKERDADARAFAKYARKSEQQAAQLAEARKALADLMPFVLESYYPQCATPEFKAAVEAAKKLTHENQDDK